MQENPLSPLVVLGRAGVKLLAPIEHRAHVFELTFHGLYVLFGAVFGVNTRLYSVILGRQSERVEAHRLENRVALHALEPRERIGGTVVIPMPEVQIRARGVGKHLENVVFLVRVLAVKGVQTFLFPNIVPLFFDCFVIHYNARSV